MEHYLDSLVMLIILIGAGFYLYKTFRKSGSGCGGGCSGCDTACKSTARQFKAKTIPIKKIA